MYSMPALLEIAELRSGNGSYKNGSLEYESIRLGFILAPAFKWASCEFFSYKK